MDGLTISEILFEQFCKDNSIRYSRIEPGESKTPDYEVYFNEHCIIAEVKQIDQNEKDKELREQVRLRKSVAFWEESGRRVRYKIDSAKKQLKYKDCPAILVLYDNVPIKSIDSDDIKSAMYGHETIRVSYYENPDGSPAEIVSVSEEFGSGRKFTQNDNTTFSAIALLYRFGGSLRLSLFHNDHAKHSIEPSWLRCDLVRHFKLGPQSPGRFQEWQEI